LINWKVKKKLPISFCQIEADDFVDAFRRHCIVGYSMPHGHTFEEAWLFQLKLDGGKTFEFSSSSTIVTGWQEVGSLNVSMTDDEPENVHKKNGSSIMVAIKPIVVSAISVLVYEDNDVVAEPGIVLSSEGDGEVIISAGIAPGCVSVHAPFSGSAFSPQFDLLSCERYRLDSHFAQRER
jgi:hypothetical protein